MGKVLVVHFLRRIIEILIRSKRRGEIKVEEKWRSIISEGKRERDDGLRAREIFIVRRRVVFSNVGFSVDHKR